MEILNQISKHLQNGDEEKAVELTKRAISDGIQAITILDDALISGMNIIGEKFKEHEIFLPDVLLAAKAMTTALRELKPLLAGKHASHRGRIVIGTVKGDLHDIGKNLVAIMLQGAGFEVIDLGKDVSPETFIEGARKENASVIGMSALLTTTMPVMKQVINLLQKKNLSGKIRTIIGGAPVDENFAREIGADDWSFDSANAVDRVKGFFN